MVNSVVLVGRLGTDPELKYSKDGKAIATFRLAVDRRSRRGEEKQTDWLTIATFGAVAENCAQYLSSGSLVAVEGQVRSHQWETDTGEKRSSVEIYGGSVQFLDKRRKGDDE